MGEGSYINEGLSLTLTTSSGNAEDSYAYLTDLNAATKYGDVEWNATILVQNADGFEEAPTLKLNDETLTLNGSGTTYVKPLTGLTVTDDDILYFGNLPDGTTIRVTIYYSYNQNVTYNMGAEAIEVEGNYYSPLQAQAVTVYNKDDIHSDSTLGITFDSGVRDVYSQHVNIGSITITEKTGTVSSQLSIYDNFDGTPYTDEVQYYVRKGSGGSLIIIDSDTSVEITDNTTIYPVSKWAKFDISNLDVGSTIEVTKVYALSDRLYLGNPASATTLTTTTTPQDITALGDMSVDQIQYSGASNVTTVLYFTDGVSPDQYGDYEWTISVNVDTTAASAISFTGDQMVITDAYTTTPLTFSASPLGTNQYIATVTRKLTYDSMLVFQGGVGGIKYDVVVSKTVTPATLTVKDADEQTVTGFLSATFGVVYDATHYDSAKSDAVVECSIDQTTAPAVITVDKVEGTISTLFGTSTFQSMIPYGFGSYPSVRITVDRDAAYRYYDTTTSAYVDSTLTANTPADFDAPSGFFSTLVEGETITYDAVTT